MTEASAPAPAPIEIPPMKVVEGTVPTPDGGAVYFLVVFSFEGGEDVAPDGSKIPRLPKDIKNWTAAVTIDNTTQFVSLSAFLAFCKALSAVEKAAKEAGL